MQPLRSATNGVSPDHCARDLLAAVPLVMRYLRAHMRRQQRAELTVPQLRALYLIGENHGTSVSDAAEHLGLSLPAASRMIDSLVRRGFAARQAYPDDRRRVSLKLTARGKTALRTCMQQAERAVARRFDKMSRQQLAEVTSAMRLLADAFAPERQPQVVS